MYLNLKLPPDPYTDDDRARALPDDCDHDVPAIGTWQGRVRCRQLVDAPTTSAYGIRPCGMPVRFDFDTRRYRHWVYPDLPDGNPDFSQPRQFGR